MEFGRVTPEELVLADFTLPPDTALTIETLKAGFEHQCDIRNGGTIINAKIICRYLKSKAA